MCDAPLKCAFDRDRDARERLNMLSVNTTAVSKVRAAFNRYHFMVTLSPQKHPDRLEQLSQQG